MHASSCHSTQHTNCSALVREFGLRNYLRNFSLQRLSSPSTPSLVRHRFGLGLRAVLALKKLLHFFGLVSQFDSLTSS